MPRQPHPVKTELARRGETQIELAAAVGSTPGILSQVLNGRVKPWPALRRKLADHLELPEEQLFPLGHGQ